jgi:hypothetical protein
MWLACISHGDCSSISYARKKHKLHLTFETTYKDTPRKLTRNAYVLLLRFPLFLSMYIYFIYTLYLLRGTSLEAKKNIDSCPPSLFMVPLGYKTCRVERETAARPRTCTEQILGLVSLFTSRGKLTSLNVKEGNSMSVEILFGMQHV